MGKKKEQDRYAIFENTGSRRRRREASEADAGAETPPPPLEEPEVVQDVKLTKLMTGDFIPAHLWMHCRFCLDEKEEHYHGSVLVFGGRVLF